MRVWARRYAVGLILAGALVLAAASGYLASVASSAGQAAPPSRTVTITVSDGATGPTGPQGPAGGTVCPDGFSDGVLQINHSGGHTNIATCIEGPP